MKTNSKIITCTNSTRTHTDFDKYTYKECRGCMFLYTYLAKSWQDDKVECRCPIKIKFGDKVKYTPEKYKKIKKSTN